MKTDNDAKEALGKPVAAWKTAVTKLTSGVGMAMSAATVALGVVFAVKGHGKINSLMKENKDVIEAFTRELKEDPAQTFAKFGVKIDPEQMETFKKTFAETDPHQMVEQFEKGAKSVINTGTALMVGGGVIGGLSNKAAWDSASSARLTRNYLKLADDVNNKANPQQQTRS